MATRKTAGSTFGTKPIKQSVDFIVKRDIQYIEVPGTNLYAFKIQYKTSPTLADKKEALVDKQGLTKKKELVAFLNNETNTIPGENIVLTSAKTRDSSRRERGDANDTKKTEKIFDQLSSGKSTADDLYAYNEETDEYTQVTTKQVLARPIALDYMVFNDCYYDLTKLSAAIWAFGESNGLKVESKIGLIPHWSTAVGKQYLQISIYPTDAQMTEYMAKGKKQHKNVEEVVTGVIQQSVKNIKFSADVSQVLIQQYHGNDSDF